MACGHTRRPREDAVALPDAPPRVPEAGRPVRRRGLLLPVSLAAVLAPFVVALVRVLAAGPAVSVAGDEALAGLAVRRAAGLDQLLGPYSQWGWNHPGPAWFYLLVPAYELGGGTDRALVAAQLTVHALLAALVVLAASSRAVPWRAPLAAAVVLVLVARLP